MNRVVLHIYVSLASLLLSGLACAQQAIQPLASIRLAAEQYVREQAPASQGRLMVTAGELDPRLRLAACPEPLAAFLPNGAQLRPRTTVGVRCQAGSEWTLYVPVMLESEVNVLVLRNAGTRLAKLTPADVEVQQRRVPGYGSGYLSDPAQLAGRHLKRALPAGSVLSPEAMATDVLIKRGQQVMLVATVGGIEVRAAGRALMDGGAAQRVRVQNLSSDKVVEGVVETGSVVRVGG